jgi:hypothetical protein
MKLDDTAKLVGNDDFCLFSVRGRVRSESLEFVFHAPPCQHRLLVVMIANVKRRTFRETTSVRGKPVEP